MRKPPAAVEGKTVIIAFPESKKFHYKGAASNQALLARVLRNVLSEAVELEFQLGAKKKVDSQQQANKFSAPNEANQAVDLVEDSSSADEQQLERSQVQKLEADLKEKSSKKINQEVKNKNIKKNNLEPKKAAAQENEDQNEPTGDLDIENLARIFAGEIIEVDQSILENRGGN
jgi:DNA polymerase-3 subunit gamma/tau